MAAETFYLWSILLTLCAGVLALIVFLIGRREYVIGQKWQRAHVVISFLDSFDKSDLIVAAAQMIDWDEREIVINGQSIKFTNKMLLSAMRTPEMDISAKRKAKHGEVIFTKEESLIRDAFDALFDYFDKLLIFREKNLLKIDDYSYFTYLLELLSDIGNYKQDGKIQTIMDNYINAYRFFGVRKLIDEYRKRNERITIGT